MHIPIPSHLRSTFYGYGDTRDAILTRTYVKYDEVTTAVEVLRAVFQPIRSPYLESSRAPWLEIGNG